MTREIYPGNYPCQRNEGSTGVNVGIVDANSQGDMENLYQQASSVRDACNAYRESECPPDCSVRRLVEDAVANLNELMGNS